MSVKPQKEITDIYGNKVSVECIGCAIQDGRIKKPGGSIFVTENFDAQQDIEIPILFFTSSSLNNFIFSVWSGQAG